MDSKYIRDNQLVERYLQGRLSDEESEEFEVYYLEHPEILDELKTAAHLRDGLQSLAASGDLAAPERPSAPSWLPRVVTTPQYSLAATFLLFASLGVSTLLYNNLSALRDASTSTRLVPLVTVRSSADEPTNVIRDVVADEFVVLLADPGPERYDTYRATVARAGRGSNKVVWQGNNLRRGYQDYLSLSIPGSALTPGDFEVRIETTRNDEFAPVRRLEFTVAE